MGNLRLWRAILIVLASAAVLSGCYYDPYTGYTYPFPFGYPPYPPPPYYYPGAPPPRYPPPSAPVQQTPLPPVAR